jgi:hypothetical protein
MLQPLDILMWRIDPGASWIDRLIGWGERKTKQSNSEKVNYYHTGLVAQDSSQFYQAKPPRVCVSPVPNPLPSYMEVYRLRKPASYEQFKEIYRYADSRLGNWYDFLGVLTAGFVQVGGLEFCSKYLNNSFDNGGIVIVPAHLLISPDDIVASPKLVRVQ